MPIQDPIHITERGASEIRDMMNRKKIPEGYSLRVGVRGGGCGASGFFLGFDKQTEKDEMFKINEIPILIDKRHLLYLFNQTVDFEERKDERGFFFRAADA